MTQEPTYDIASFTGLTLNPETLSDNVAIHSVGNEQNNVTSTNNKKHVNSGDSGNTLSIRSLLTIKDAGVIIGKGGTNVAEVREITGVRAGISKVVNGVNERILNVSGNLDSVAKAYSLFARYLLENASTPITNVYSNNFSFLNYFTNNNNSHNYSNNSNTNHEPVTAIHLLISHLLLGSIIGKSGTRIKEIQESSNARIVASKDMLSQSTERVIDIIGTVDSIQIAVRQIGECILNDAEKNINCIQYQPTIRNNISTMFNHQMRNNGYERQFDRNNNGNYEMRGGSEYYRENMNTNGTDKRRSFVNKSKSNEALDVKKINVPADMVGCIIGRGGKRITEIRTISGSKITISPSDVNNATNKNQSNEREFTITGTSKNIDQALYLIYSQLDQEKQRRLNNDNINNNNKTNSNDNDSSEVNNEANASSTTAAANTANTTTTTSS